MSTEPDLQQAVPFFAVSNMQDSLRFYVDGLGFEIADPWEDEGKFRWCRLVRGGATLMVQDFSQGRRYDLVTRRSVGSRGVDHVHLRRRLVGVPAVYRSRTRACFALRGQRHVGHVAARSRRLPHRVRESDGCPRGQHFLRQGDGCPGIAAA